MHVLLPPSEGKAAGGRGRALRRTMPTNDSSTDDPLALARRRAIDALLQLATGDPATAAEALLLPAGVAAAALEANAAVVDSPTTPALRRYSGVVYAGLDYAALDAAEQRIAARCCLIFSGLFGVVAGNEPVPDYRVPAKAVLPGLGVAGTFWRPVLDEVLRARLGRGLIVDLRSSDYAAMWRPSREMAERVIAVRVLSPAPRGGHAVISYNSKFAKGRLAAELIRRVARKEPVATADDVAAAWLAWEGAADARRTASGFDLYTR